MRKTEAGKQETGGAVLFTVPGLIFFSVALVLAGGVLALAAARGRSPGRLTAKTAMGSAQREKETSIEAPRDTPPWGELLTREIELERPEEYVASEITTYQFPRWTFAGQKSEDVRTLMLSCGLSEAQAGRALGPAMAKLNGTDTIVEPDDELVYSLAPETRSRLYRELARNGDNHFMQFPFCVPGKDVSAWFDNSNVDDAVIGKIKRLVYSRGDVQFFSDFEVVMRGLPSEQEKLWLVRALSRQKGLLVRVRVRPDTDVDKMLGYWDRGVQAKDARPLLESLKRLPEGATLSLMYLLPKFARERLYTFPTPPRPNASPMDCHWSTMNFFNESPDDRFSQPAFTVEYLKTNCYTVSKANQYGDMVLVLDEKGNGVHSAVYLADDIVFTKNGNNYTQPWMLKRLKDLLADYSTRGAVKVAVYRRNGW